MMPVVEARCPESLARTVDAIAETDRVSKSEVVRHLLVAGLLRLAEPRRSRAR